MAKWSVKTLADLISLIPRDMQTRYSGTAFSREKANSVLAELEQIADPDFFKTEGYIVLTEGLKEYAFGDSIRQIRGIFQVESGDTTPDKKHPVLFEIIGKVIRLSSDFTMSGDDDVAGTATGGSLLDLTGDFSAYEEDELLGRLATITHLAGGTSQAIIRSNTTTTISFARSLSTTVANGDTFSITNNYLVTEYVRYLARFETSASVFDMPIDYEQLMVVGLKAQYYEHQDPASTEAKNYRGIYGKLVESFQANENRQRNYHPRQSGRSFPSLY